MEVKESHLASPLQGFQCNWFFSQGLRPGLICSAPSGLSNMRLVKALDYKGQVRHGGVFGSCN